jgi:hypothetical protein
MTAEVKFSLLEVYKEESCTLFLFHSLKLHYLLGYTVFSYKWRISFLLVHGIKGVTENENYGRNFLACYSSYYRRHIIHIICTEQHLFFLQNLQKLYLHQYVTIPINLTTVRWGYFAFKGLLRTIGFIINFLRI